MLSFWWLTVWSFIIVVRTREPYTLQEKGWGAFDLRIIFHFVDNLVAPQLMWFDLNFAQEAYSVTETLVSQTILI